MNISKNEITIRKLAELTGIPRTTIERRILDLLAMQDILK